MEGKTHALGGAAAGIAVTAWAGYDPLSAGSLVAVAGAIAGGHLPDICHPQSAIGRSVPFLSKPINLVFGHRTVTHSLLFVVGITWALTLINVYDPLILGLFVGMFSHLLLDAVTKQGIKLLWPLPWTFRLPPGIRTGGGVEKVVAFLLFVFIVAAIAYGIIGEG